MRSPTALKYVMQSRADRQESEDEDEEALEEEDELAEDVYPLSLSLASSPPVASLAVFDIPQPILTDMSTRGSIGCSPLR